MPRVLNALAVLLFAASASWAGISPGTIAAENIRDGTMDPGVFVADATISPAKIQSGSTYTVGGLIAGGDITAGGSFIGTLTGSSSLNVLKTGDSMSGQLTILSSATVDDMRINLELTAIGDVFIAPETLFTTTITATGFATERGAFGGPMFTAPNSGVVNISGSGSLGALVIDGRVSAGNPSVVNPKILCITGSSSCTLEFRNSSNVLEGSFATFGGAVNFTAGSAGLPGADMRFFVGAGPQFRVWEINGTTGKTHFGGGISVTPLAQVEFIAEIYPVIVRISSQIADRTSFFEVNDEGLTTIRDLQVSLDLQVLGGGSFVDLVTVSSDVHVNGTRLIVNGVITSTAANVTGASTAEEFIGPLTGNADTSTSLAANGTNCAIGEKATGTDASGNAEGCSAVAENDADEIITGAWTFTQPATIGISTGTKLNDTKKFIFIKSVDGATQSSACVVVIRVEDSSDNPNLIFTSTTTGSLGPLGVLADTCSPGSVCKVQIGGLARHFGIVSPTLFIGIASNVNRCFAQGSVPANTHSTGKIHASDFEMYTTWLDWR